MFNPKNILVTTDFTEESGRALRETLDIADKYQSTVHLLHVIENIQQCSVDYCLSESEILAEKNKLLEEGMNKMNGEISLIAQGRTVPILKEIRFGHTIDEIIKYEGEKKIDLVVTAPHKAQNRWWRNVAHLTNNLVSKSLCETMVIK